ncbi:MAG: hypothetical protein D6784_03560 [Chloroflexi bacterium]|nr:MAG: hypothetical protein D6784_03560 [Chloroflexota bacterium]
MELKLLLAYNIKPHREAEYYRFVMGEFLPAVQNLGLYMVEGWQTAYGSYPARLLGFRANSNVDIPRLLRSPEWQEARDKLLRYVSDYEERVVPARNMFQFFIPKDR